ncbi:hypothetical protein GCM10023311_19320 [Flaviramulus aquimarinus]|uniref:Secretion system C-terminal sorting domain-containing protein n=1 Tax=Flaviramulus aquimarinus TaxID=1170456 RepID=A0ABP9F6Q2_9FLAO
MAIITFNACHPLLENQDYTFNQISTDATGRNVFETDPINGDQNCGGLGVCEMRVAWNEDHGRWEIYADDGNGTFTNNYLLYHNVSASAPNPPSLTLGTWEENILVTESLCIDGINILSGNLQDAILGVKDEILNELVVYPTLVKEVLNISTNEILKSVKIYDMTGKLVLYQNENPKKINVSKLPSGFYFLKVQFDDFITTKKIIVN